MSAASIAANADADARRGAAIVRRFANAVATWPDGSTAEVIFERRSDRATLGGLGVAGRDITIEAITAQVPESVTDASRITVTMGNAPAVELGPYRVQRGGRTDDLEEAVTLLALERA